MLWNANGLHKYKKELEVVLETEKIDVCLIAETHFTNESYFKIKTLKHTTLFSLCARGGSAVIVRSSIKHHEDARISSDIFQTTSVIIETDNSPLCLTSLYSQPRHSIKAENYKDLFNLALSSTVIDKSIPPHLCNKYTDWSYFKYILQKNALYSCFPQNELDINEELLKITQEIKKAKRKSTPIIKRRLAGKTPCT